MVHLLEQYNHMYYYRIIGFTPLENKVKFLIVRAFTLVITYDTVILTDIKLKKFMIAFKQPFDIFVCWSLNNSFYLICLISHSFK